MPLEGDPGLTSQRGLVASPKPRTSAPSAAAVLVGEAVGIWVGADPPVRGEQHIVVGRSVRTCLGLGLGQREIVAHNLLGQPA